MIEFEISYTERTITLTKKDMTAAQKYGSDAYKALQNARRENPGFAIVLSHRPELFDAYAACNPDLVLSGHAHGGQFRLPVIGGLYAPGQGVFPQYDAGLYEQEATSMVVSRGIGNSLFPLRVFNPPEIVAIDLQTE